MIVKVPPNGSSPVSQDYSQLQQKKFSLGNQFSHLRQVGGLSLLQKHSRQQYPFSRKMAQLDKKSFFHHLQGSKAQISSSVMPLSDSCKHSGSPGCFKCSTVDCGKAVLPIFKDLKPDVALQEACKRGVLGFSLCCQANWDV